MRLALLLLVSATALWGNAVETSQIRWFKNIKQGLAEAKALNKPILIDFWADWCSPCKEMDANVYTNPTVAEAINRRLVAVRIHLDMQPEVARQYNVGAIPDLIFTDVYGTVLLRNRGEIGVFALSKIVAALPKDLSEINRLDGKLQTKRNDFDTLLAMGRSLRSLGFYEASGDFFARAIQQGEAKARPQAREAALHDMGLNYLELHDGSRAAEAFERWLKDFPASPRRPEAMLNLVHAYVIDGQGDKARKTLNNLRRDFPASDTVAKAQALIHN